MRARFLTRLSVTALLTFSVTLPVAGCAMTEGAAIAKFLPPPPVSAEALRADELARSEGIRLREGERGIEAAFDSQKVSSRWIEAMMSPVLGMTLGKTETPAVHALIKTSLKAAKRSSRAAKGRFYGRERPFVTHPDDLTCNREVRDELNKKSSYPSGHTTAVWTAGLALAAAFPEKAGEILDRAYRAGDNRWICGHHWQSDVEAGRALAAATFARLAAEREFGERLEAARLEFAQSK